MESTADLRMALADADVRVHLTAAEQYRTLGTDAVETLLNALEDSDPLVRRRAADLLGIWWTTERWNRSWPD